MVNNFVNSNQMISVDGRFSGINYGSWIEREKRLNQNIIRLDNMKRLKNTGLQFNFLTYHINNNYAEKLFNEIKEDYKTLSELNEIQEEHMRSFSDILDSSLIDKLTIFTAKYDPNVLEYSPFQNLNFIYYKDSLVESLYPDGVIKQYNSRQISYEYTHNLFTNSHLHFTSIVKTGSVSYNGIFQSYVPHIYEQIEGKTVSSVSKLESVKSTKYIVSMCGEQNFDPNQLYIEFDEDLAYYTVSSVTYNNSAIVDNIYKIDFNEDERFFDFSGYSLMRDTGNFVRYLPFYGSLMKNLHRNYDAIFNPKNDNNTYIKHNFFTIHGNKLRTEFNNKNYVHIDSTNNANLNCLRFSVNNSVMRSFENNELSYITSEFFYKNYNILNLKWKPVKRFDIIHDCIFSPDNIIELIYDKTVIDENNEISTITEYVNYSGEITILANSKIHITTKCKNDQIHYKIAKIAIKENEYETNSLPKIFMTDKHSFDLYGIGNGKYELNITILGEYGEYIVTKNIINVICQSEINNLEYIVEQFNENDFSVKVRIKEKNKGVKLPDSINVAISTQTQNVNTLNENFIKDVKYINWDMYDGYFASFIIFFDKEKLKLITTAEEGKEITNKDIIENLIDKFFNIDVYCFETKNHKENYTIHNICGKIITYNLETINDDNENGSTSVISTNDINNTSKLFEIEKIKNLFSSAIINWRLFNNDKRLYDIKEVNIKNNNHIILEYKEEKLEKFKDISLLDIQDKLNFKHKDVELEFKISSTDFISITFDCELFNIIENGIYINRLLIDPNSIKLNGKLNGHYCKFYIDTIIDGVSIDNQNYLVCNTEVDHNIEKLTIYAINDFTNKKFEIDILTQSVNNILSDIKYETLPNNINIYTLNTNKEYNLSYISETPKDLYLYYTNVKYSTVLPITIYPDDNLGARLYGHVKGEEIGNGLYKNEYVVWINLGPYYENFKVGDNKESYKSKLYIWQQYDRNTGKFVDKTKNNAFILTKQSKIYNVSDLNISGAMFSSFEHDTLIWNNNYIDNKPIFDYYELGDTSILPNNYKLIGNRLFNLDNYLKSSATTHTTYKPLNIFENNTSNKINSLYPFEIKISSDMIKNVFDENDFSINIFDYIIISEKSDLSGKAVIPNDDNKKTKTIKLYDDKTIDNYIYMYSTDLNLFFDDNVQIYELELKDILRKIAKIPIYHFNDKKSNYPTDTNYDNLLHRKNFYGSTELISSQTSNFNDYTNVSTLSLVNDRFWGISYADKTKYFAYSVPAVSFNSEKRFPFLHYVIEGNDIFNYFLLYSNISKLYKDFEWSRKTNDNTSLYSSLAFSKLQLSNNDINEFINRNINTSEPLMFTKYIGIEQNVEDFGINKDIFHKTEIKKENVLNLYFKNKNEYDNFWIKRIDAYDELLNILIYFDNYKDLTPLELANKLTMHLYPNNRVEAGFMVKDNGLNALRNRQLLKNKTRYDVFTNNGKKPLYSNAENSKKWNNFLYTEIISKFIPTFHINENILSDIADYGLCRNINIPSDSNYGINNKGEIATNNFNVLNKLNYKTKQYSYIYDKDKNIINISYTYKGDIKKTFYAKHQEPEYYLSYNESYLGLLYYPRYTIDNGGKIVPTSYLTYQKNNFTYTLNYSYYTIDTITNALNGVTANETTNTDISYYVVSYDGSYITKRDVELQQMLPEYSYNFKEKKYSYNAYTINKNGEIIKYEFDHEIENSHFMTYKNEEYIFGTSFYSNENIIKNTNDAEDIFHYGIYDQIYSYEGVSYNYNVIKYNETRDIENAIKIQQYLCKYLINEVEKTSLMINIFNKSKKLLETLNNNNYVVTGIELDRDYITVNSEILDIKVSYTNINTNEYNSEIKQIYLPHNTYLSWVNNDIYAYASKVQIDDSDKLDEKNTYNGYFWHDFNNGYTFKYLKRSLKFNDVILESDFSNTLYNIKWDDVTKLSISYSINYTNNSDYLYVMSSTGGSLKNIDLNERGKKYKFFTYTLENQKINYIPYTLDEIYSYVYNNEKWLGYCFDINQQHIYHHSDLANTNDLIYYNPDNSYYSENKSLISLSYTYELVFNNNLISLDIDLPPYSENEEKWKCDVEICYLGIPNNKLHENEPYIWITPHNKDFEPFGIWAYNIKDIDVEVQTNFANRNYLFDKDKYMYKFAYDFRYFQGPWAYTNTDIPNVRNYDNYETVKNHEYAFVSGLENTNYMLTSEHLFDPVAARVSSNYVSKINNYIFGENQPFEFYLGSINEWQLVSDNIQEISKKVLELNGDPLYDGQKKYNNPAYYLYWTSSEESTDCAWNIFLNECTFREQNKNSHLFVRPFFKIKNEIPTFTNVIFENVINASNIVELNPDKRVTSPGSTPTTINEALGNFAKIKDKFYAINIIYDYDQFNVDKLLEGNFYPQPYSNVSLSDMFWKTEYEYIIDDINELTYISYKLPNSNTQYKCDINGLLSLYNKSAYEYFAKTHYDNVIPGCSLAYILNYINNNDKILYYNAKPYDSENVGNINFFTELSDNIDNEMLNNKLLENKKLACLTILAISNQCKSSKFVRSFPSVGVFNNRYEQKFEITSYSFGTDNILTINPNVSSGIVDNSVVNWESNVWQVSTEGKTIHDSLKKYINFEPISLLVHNHKLNYINDGENSYSYLYNETIAITHSYLTYTCIIKTESLIKGPQYISGQSPLTPPIITPQ